MSTEKTDLDSLVLQVGEVSATPTANTVLDRLKSIQANTLGSTTPIVKIDPTQNTIKIDPANNVVVSTKTNQVIQAQFTRPNNVIAYLSHDVEGTIAGSNMQWTTTLPNASRFRITSLKCSYLNGFQIANMSDRRLHIYNASPTAINDHVAMDIIVGDHTKYLGYIAMNTIGDDLGATLLWNQYLNINFTGTFGAGASSIFGVVETNIAYTPIAQLVEKFEITIESY